MQESAIPRCRERLFGWSVFSLCFPATGPLCIIFINDKCRFPDGCCIMPRGILFALAWYRGVGSSFHIFLPVVSLLYRFPSVSFWNTVEAEGLLFSTCCYGSGSLSWKRCKGHPSALPRGWKCSLLLPASRHLSSREAMQSWGGLPKAGCGLRWLSPLPVESLGTRSHAILFKMAKTIPHPLFQFKRIPWHCPPSLSNQGTFLVLSSLLTTFWNVRP